MKMELTSRLNTVEEEEEERPARDQQHNHEHDDHEASRRPPLQKGVTVSEIYLKKPIVTQTCTKSPQVKAVYVPMSPSERLSKLHLLQKRTTHGGEFNPAWRTQEAIVPVPRDSASCSHASSCSSSTSATISSGQTSENMSPRLTMPRTGLEFAQILKDAIPCLADLNLSEYINADDVLMLENFREDLPGQVIGQGAQGTIFKSCLTGHEETTLAIKVGRSRAILEEYVLAKKFSHPNILKHIGFSIAQQDPEIPSPREHMSGSSSLGSSYCTSCYGEQDWIFMSITEYCCNGNLMSYVSRNPEKCKDTAFLKSLFTSLLQGLDHIHSHGYVHCDIKPDNILIACDGSPKIADFGLGQLISDNMLPQGTPSFLAPEVVEAWHTAGKTRHRFSEKIDIFSLGVTAVLITTGKYPFSRISARLTQGEAFTTAELDHIFQLSRSKQEHLQSLSPTLARLINFCLSNKAISRPTAKQLLQILS